MSLTLKLKRKRHFGGEIRDKLFYQKAIFIFKEVTGSVLVSYLIPLLSR